MAYLTESKDARSWDLTGYFATQLYFNVASMRVIAWTMSATFDVRFGTTFELIQSDGSSMELDPENSAALAPALALVGRALRSLIITRAGELSLGFADGTVLCSDSHPAFEAWEVRGSGALESIGYFASPGGGSPWG